MPEVRATGEPCAEWTLSSFEYGFRVRLVPLGQLRRGSLRPDERKVRVPPEVRGAVENGRNG